MAVRYCMHFLVHWELNRATSALMDIRSGSYMKIVTNCISQKTLCQWGIQVQYATYLLETTVNSGGGGGRGSYSAGLCLLSEGFLFLGRLWFINLVALCSTLEVNKYESILQTNIFPEHSRENERTEVVNYTYVGVWHQQLRAACMMRPGDWQLMLQTPAF